MFARACTHGIPLQQVPAVPALPADLGPQRRGEQLVTPLRVTDVRLVPACPANGLLGYLSCKVAGLRLDGLTLHRTRAGTFVVSFPCRRDRRGRKHPIVRPTGPALERAILAALRRTGAIP